ncbi:MAG: TadG family pilus assembly protein [Bryobacteraceae bacterium]
MTFVRVFQRGRRQKGFIAVTFAVMITAMVGFAGLAVDAGYMQWNKRRVQLAADAAAMGALREMQRGHDSSAVSAAALNDSALNGFVNGASNTTVTINRPPTSGAFSGNASAVQAVVRRNFPTMFMRIFGQNTVSIAASAVARTTISTGSIGGCIFALNKTMASSINMNGTTLNLNISCSVIDESNNGGAYSMGGGAVLRISNQAKVGVVGGWTLGGQSQILNVSSSPYTSQSPVHISDPGDPLAGVPAPSSVVGNPGYVGASNLTVRTQSGVTYSKNNVPAGNSIQPGVYCGGIKLGDSNGVDYTFQPGMYILVGGGLDAGSSAKAHGSGVTFYNTQRTASQTWGCSSAQSYTPLSVTGQATLTLSAPNTASGCTTWCGMLFLGDRTLGAGNGKFDQIVGGSTGTLDGAAYFPKSNVKFAGNSSTTGYLVLVADNISIVGTSTFGSNYSSLPAQNPFAPYSTGGGLVE